MEYKKFLIGIGLSSALILAGCGTEEEDTDTGTNTDVGENPEVIEEDNGEIETNEEVEKGTGEDVDDVDEDVDVDEGTSNSNSKSKEGDKSKLGFNKTPNEAIAEAKDRFNGELTKLEIEMEDSEWVYKVELEGSSGEYSVEMLVNNLAILEEETEDDSPDDDNEQFNYEELVTYDEAIALAKTEGEGEFKELELSKDDNRVKYEIELTNDVGIEIDALTGEIVEID